MSEHVHRDCAKTTRKLPHGMYDPRDETRTAADSLLEQGAPIVLIALVAAIAMLTTAVWVISRVMAH